MSKIVVIKGSARKGGNSNSMADAFIEAAKGLGHEIVECNATKMNLNGCHGCMTCFKTGKACTHDDDFNTIADDLIEADGWVFSFPVYWYTMPGQTKCILDNIFSFAVGGKSCKGKKVALISCCEENDMTVFDHAVGPFECLVLARLAKSRTPTVATVRPSWRSSSSQTELVPSTVPCSR